MNAHGNLLRYGFVLDEEKPSPILKKQNTKTPHPVRHHHRFLNACQQINPNTTYHVQCRQDTEPSFTLSGRDLIQAMNNGAIHPNTHAWVPELNTTNFLELHKKAGDHD